MPATVVTVSPWQYTMNLHSIFCKIDANGNKSSVLLEPHSSFRFQYRLLTMTTLFEIAVYPGRGVLPYSLGGGVPLGSRKSYPLLDKILQIL